MSHPPLCIYHGNCQDGFAAAWVVRRHFPDAEFHAGVYQDPPPDVTGRDVILVDFSYKRPMLAAMATSARSLLVLDHHKSAAEDLSGFPDAPPARGWFAPRSHYLGMPVVLFDMNRSGAGLTWDWFNPGEPRPALIDHIEDRDLWRFKLSMTREIAAAVFSYPYSFSLWDSLMSEDVLPNLMIEGGAIERKHHQDIANILPVVRREMVIGGHRVPVANLPLTMTSDAGHALCEPYDQGLAGSYIPPFAACYWDTPEGRVFSLRSRDNGADVSAIAKRYGGGGREHAAGFRAACGWEGDE